MAYASVALSGRRRRAPELSVSPRCSFTPGPMHDPVALLWLAVVGIGNQHVVQTQRRWHGRVSRPPRDQG